MAKKLQLTLAGGLLLLVSCTPAAVVPALPPTVSPLFSRGQGATPTAAAPVSTGVPGLAVATVAPAPPSAEPQPTRTAEMVEVPIYDEGLDPAWSVEHSASMRIDLNAAPSHSGQKAIALTPEADYATLYFTVREQSKQAFPQDRVLGAQFWLYSGDAPLDPADVAVTIVGSNAYPYWLAGDHSVPLDAGREFSETRLYDLGFNRTIPAATWEEVTVWLDDLLYQADARYVTGLYLKTDAGFRRTLYVDQVALLEAPAP